MSDKQRTDSGRMSDRETLIFLGACIIYSGGNQGMNYSIQDARQILEKITEQPPDDDDLYMGGALYGHTGGQLFLCIDPARR